MSGSAAASNLTGTLARGLAVLKVITDTPRPMMLGEIAAACALDQSTTLRLLRSLEEAQYIIRMRGSKNYIPSPQAMRPLSLMHPIEQFRRDTANVITALAEAAEQTVVLALFVGTERMVVDIVQRPGSISPYYDNWLRGPLHATATGKAFLTTKSVEDRKALLGQGPFKEYTPHTITDSSELDEDLSKINTLGYVRSEDEYKVGLTAISTPIWSWNKNAIGCLTITGPSDAFKGEKVDQAGKAIVQSAQMVLYHARTLLFLEEFSDKMTPVSAG